MEIKGKRNSTAITLLDALFTHDREFYHRAKAELRTTYDGPDVYYRLPEWVWAEARAKGIRW